MKKTQIIYLCIFLFLVASFTVVFAVNFDFNNDGVVNITDLQNIASHYHGKATYNSTFDLNNDSVVNVFDVVALARNVSLNTTPLNISNIGQGYTQSTLANGSLVWGDRTSWYEKPVDQYVGMKYILTNNNDKQTSGSGSSWLNFTVNVPVTVYVARDRRLVNNIPSWLSNWTQVQYPLTAGNLLYDVYYRQFSAGNITLGGNGDPFGYAMYTVLVSDQSPIPPLATPPDTGRPNLPPGLTVIGYDDGSIRGVGETGTFSSGYAFGFPWAESWGWDSNIHPTEDDALQVVNDSTNPTGSGKALFFNWSQDTNPDSSNLAAELVSSNFSGGPYDTLYIDLKMKWDGNWTANGDGHKFFYIGMPIHSGPNFFVTREPDGSSILSEEGYSFGNRNAITLPVGTWSDDNAWHNIEWVFHTQSAPGVQDGTAQWYIDDTLVGNTTDINWDDQQFGDIFWYGAANFHYNESDDYRIGELYIAAA